MHFYRLSTTPVKRRITPHFGAGVPTGLASDILVRSVLVSLIMLLVTNRALLASACTVIEKNADYSPDNGAANSVSVTANISAVGDLVAITAWCYSACSPVSVKLGTQTAVQTSVSGINGSGSPGTGQGYIFYILSASAANPQTLTFTASGTHTDIQTSYIDFSAGAGCTFTHDVDSPSVWERGGLPTHPPSLRLPVMCCLTLPTQLSTSTV